MDTDRKEITRRIFNFTLEMLYLLSGEDYMVVKKTSGDCVPPNKRPRESGGWMRPPITEPPPHPPIHERSSKRILELTNKIIELLTGEVPVRCQDVTVFFSMEEWEYVEGHKDLYKDVMEDPRTSAERCPTPPYSKDRPEENHNIPENHQGENRMDIKVEVLDEAGEEMNLRGDQQYRSGASPQYPQEESPIIPETHQEDFLTAIKVEVEAGEERMMGDPLSVGNAEEEILLDVTAETPSVNSDGNFLLLLNYKVEDGAILPPSTGENYITLNVHPDVSYTPPNHEDPCPDHLQMVPPSAGQIGGKRFQCGDCGKQFTKSSGLLTHRRIHTGEKPFSCSECEKCFSSKSNLVTHERIHTGEKLHSCSLCGRCFTDKSSLVRHERSHTGEKPYSCLECGKGFVQKSDLVKHERIHTGERLYSCMECGKCFTSKSNQVTHERIHTGERLYSCSECGKCFTSKSNLIRHERSHTGEKPFSCSECVKCFITKAKLMEHQRSHTGEKPYSCTLCGKCFTKKAILVIHERSHTGEKPYSCTECGKGFISKGKLKDHQRRHTGKKPG